MIRTFARQLSLDCSGLFGQAQAQRALHCVGLTGWLVLWVVFSTAFAFGQAADAILGPQYVITADGMGRTDCYKLTAREFQQQFGFPVNRLTIQSPMESEGSHLSGFATFDISYTGFTPEAAAAFQHAIDVWSTIIESPVAIKIDAVYASLGPGILGSAGPTWIIPLGLSGFPVSSAWFASALADQIEGIDTLPGEMDITVTLNSDFASWYLGIDGNPAPGEYDFVTVVLHEIAHGLGFTDSFGVNSGIGEWGISGDPMIYDIFVEDLPGSLLIDTGIYPNPSGALGDALTSNQVYFGGLTTPRSRLYAPFPFQPGSSIAHLDDATYPAGSENALMTAALSGGEAIHDPGPITRSIFEDIGWAVSTDCGLSCDEEGNVGIGIVDPERQLHLRGSNSVFRMDRTANTAAFMLVRIDGSGNPWKTFVLGTDATGPGHGELVVNDLGQAVGGPGVRRMTITNEGNAIFTGQVTASAFFQSSSREYKTDIAALENPSKKVRQLRGVEFSWKQTGERSIGLIAEEVARVLPESVAWEEGGKNAVGINYGSLVGLLVEAAKEQQDTIEDQAREIEQLRRQNEELAERLASIESKLDQ